MNIIFPQYRRLSNGKSLYEICSEKSFNEIQIIGNKRIMFQLNAETYFEKIKISDMLSKKRSRNYSKPRQLAMALTRELTNLSFPEIGEAYGGRHHTTVMHACDEMEQLRQNDQTIARDIAFLVQVIRD